MKYNIRDKWLAISVYKNPVDKGQHNNVTGTTKWKVCGSKSIASKYVNSWVTERDSNGEFPLMNRVIQCKEIGTLIKDYGMFNGKDSQKVVEELRGIANEMINMASNLGLSF